MARDVEQYRFTHHTFFVSFVDAVLQRPEAGDALGWIAVIQLSVIPNMSQSVPLRAALQRHYHVIVGEAHRTVLPQARHGSLDRRGGIRRVLLEANAPAVDGHQVDRVGTEGEVGTLGTIGVEVDAEREQLALLDKARCLPQLIRRDIVERPELVVGAPLSPVAYSFCNLVELLGGIHLLLRMTIGFDKAAPLRPVASMSHGRAATRNCTLFTTHAAGRTSTLPSA